MNPMLQKNKNEEDDPLTAHVVASLFHSYIGEQDKAKDHLDMALEFFRFRHLKMRLT